MYAAILIGGFLAAFALGGMIGFGRYRSRRVFSTEQEAVASIIELRISLFLEALLKCKADNAKKREVMAATKAAIEEVKRAYYILTPETREEFEDVFEDVLSKAYFVTWNGIQKPVTPMEWHSNNSTTGPEVPTQ